MSFSVRTALINQANLQIKYSINIKDSATTNRLSVAEVVVSVLFDHSAATLERFFDLSHEFKFHLRHKYNDTSLEMCIIRRGITVTVRDTLPDASRWCVLTGSSAAISRRATCARQMDCGSIRMFTQSNTALPPTGSRSCGKVSKSVS